MRTQNRTAFALAKNIFTTAVFGDRSWIAPATGPASSTARALAPDLIIYGRQLPSAEELTGMAEANGVSVKQITQTARELNIVFQAPDGRTRMVAYHLLPDAGANADRTAARAAVPILTPPATRCPNPECPGYSNPPVSRRFDFGSHRESRW